MREWFLKPLTGGPLGNGVPANTPLYCAEATVTPKVPGLRSSISPKLFRSSGVACPGTTDDCCSCAPVVSASLAGSSATMMPNPGWITDVAAEKV